jgi:threonine aldolase
METCAFYVWNEARDEVRLVASWDTTAEDVDGFLGELKRLLGS